MGVVDILKEIAADKSNPNRTAAAKLLAKLETKKKKKDADGSALDPATEEKMAAAAGVKPKRVNVYDKNAAVLKLGVLKRGQ